MSKYLLIDGNNLACRSAFSNESLTNVDGVPSGVHFGVMGSLINLKNKFPDYQMIIAWDGKSSRRMRESEEGVSKGIIPELYKANRKKEVMPKPLLDFYAQSDFLKRGIGQLGIPQVFYSQYEADDILATYARNLRDDNEVVLVTSDKDYYAMLHKNVSIWDGMKQIVVTIDSFRKDYNLEPEQWTHVGALMGDDGDNIFGVDGVGIKTALELISQHHDFESVIKACDGELNGLRVQYPDLCLDEGNRDKFKKLMDIEKKNGAKKYPYLYWNMPYTGVLFELEFGKVKKFTKTSLLIVMFQDVIRLAYSLKKVDDNIENLPSIEQQEKNLDRLMEYLTYYDIYSLDINSFFY